MQLSPVDTRVLGCLMEKERTTPENYPLSLNGLLAACNQTTNREPILVLSEREVEASLDSLRQKKLATVIFGGGSRVQKYRHLLHEHYNLTAQESVLLCVLLLRGPQTAGELRARAERMAPFAALADVENALTHLGEGADPLVRLLPARPGQKERRYVQLLSGEPAEAPVQSAAAATYPDPQPAAAEPRIDSLEKHVEDLRAQLAALQESFAELKRQLGG